MRPAGPPPTTATLCGRSGPGLTRSAATGSWSARYLFRPATAMGWSRELRVQAGSQGWVQMRPRMPGKGQRSRTTARAWAIFPS